MRKLRIAYFISARNSYLGGADQTLFMQAVLMHSYQDVMVILPCDADGVFNDKFQRKCEKYGLHYEILEYGTAYSIKAIDMIDYCNYVEGVERFILETGFDILHSVQINPAVEYVARKHHIPHVMNIYWLKEWEWKVSLPDIFPRYVSCDSEFYLNKWIEYLNCRGECIRVYGDVEVGEKEIKNKDGIILGTSGTVCFHKNQLEIIKTVERMIKKGRKIKLIIAGRKDLSYASDCERYIKEHHLQNHIQLIGFLEDMRSFLDKIDVYVCASKLESFPASIVEAVSCNIPIISTPVAGVPEILVHRENAYIADGYSADELTIALEEFLEDYKTNRLSEVLINERNTYEKYFSPEAVRKQLMDMYNGMLDDGVYTGDMQIWNDIQERIAQMGEKLNEEDLSIEDKMRMHSRLLYFLHIKSKITAKQCYIWGAGKWGNITRVLLESLAEDIEIKAFVDEKRREAFAGIEVIGKEEMDLQEETAVFIGFADRQEEAISYLQERNMEILKNIFIIV